MKRVLFLASMIVACSGGSVNGDDGGPLADGASLDGGDGGDGTSSGHAIKTVFLILMENHSWSTISASGSAKYINGTLVPMGAHAEQYFTPPGNHPSEPNYIWLEAGGNLGITNDDDPSSNHQSTPDHLVTQLKSAGVSWRAYVEDIPGTSCPLASSGLFAAKHTPQLFFDDVMTDCQTHVRPYTELANDLKTDKTARYNFITPNLCDDMHGETFGTTCNTFTADMIKKGDDWLAAQVPVILGSNAYKNGGVLFVLWDEGDEGLGTASDGPIPLVVVSPLAKTSYKSMTKFTHSSMLRTVEEIFGVPLLRDAAKATDLSELFTKFP